MHQFLHRKSLSHNVLSLEILHPHLFNNFRMQLAFFVITTWTVLPMYTYIAFFISTTIQTSIHLLVHLASAPPFSSGSTTSVCVNNISGCPLSKTN
jgi:hypothetical protein